MSSSQNQSTNKVNKKRTNTRPCDACSVRRVRCDISTSKNGRCTNCINHDIDCTNLRVRQKSGPKNIKQKTRQNIVSLINNGQLSLVNHNTSSQNASNQNNNCSNIRNNPQSTGENDANIITCNIPLEKLLPYLQIYQTWYYGLWPVLSVAHLVSRVIDNHIVMGQTDTTDGKVKIDEKNAPAYALCCAVCATIAVQVRFLKSATGLMNVDNALKAEEYALEAKRIRYLFEEKMDPSIDTLLSSFFLYMYYGNITGGTKRGIVYLREAISMAQMLGLHDPDQYNKKSSAEIHRCKKIYYMLLVTERYTCFQEKIPVLLDPTVDLPSLRDEEYPELLVGFTELVEVFSATEKQFFQEINHKLFLSDNDNEKLDADLSMFQDFLQNQSTDMKRQWIGQMQVKLNKKLEQNIASDSQKLNIVLSKSWFQSLGWLISSENYLVSQNYSMENCFSVKFPIKIAHDFLTQTKDLPEFAFESNGSPGVCYKLLEIADSLYSFSMQSTIQRESARAMDQLDTIFQMIVRFKTHEVQLPKRLFGKIQDLIESKRLNFRQPDPIEYLLDTDDINEDATEQQNSLQSPQTDMINDLQINKNSLSPYSQFTMCYGVPSPPVSNQITEL